MSIATEAMVVNLHLGMWEGRKLDKEAGRKVISEAGAAQDTATVNKLIVPKESLAPLQTSKGAIYSHFLTHTLPWKDNGDRLLSRKMYMRFIEGHEALVQAHMANVDHFIDVVYPAAVAQAQFRMAALFRASDYPQPSELRGKFYATLAIDAVTEGSDFRVKMDEDTTARIQAQIEDNLNKRVGAVMEKVWRQLLEALEHYAERMKAGEGSKLYDSVKDNLIEMCDILPGLNILNDPNLRAMGKEIKVRLERFDFKDMRNPKTRESVKSAAAAEADAIVQQMKGFMAAFAGEKETE